MSTVAISWESVADAFALVAAGKAKRIDGAGFSVYAVRCERGSRRCSDAVVTAPVLRIEAPSDAQLRYIRGLCDEYGWQHPAAVASKAEASAIIGAMKDGSYRASDWEWLPDGVPF